MSLNRYIFKFIYIHSLKCDLYYIRTNRGSCRSTNQMGGLHIDRDPYSNENVVQFFLVFDKK